MSSLSVRLDLNHTKGYLKGVIRKTTRQEMPEFYHRLDDGRREAEVEIDSECAALLRFSRRSAGHLLNARGRNRHPMHCL